MKTIKRFLPHIVAFLFGVFVCQACAYGMLSFKVAFIITVAGSLIIALAFLAVKDTHQ